MRPAADILARVEALTAAGSRERRTLLLRWAGVLRANDPEEADALLNALPVWSPREKRIEIAPIERADDEAPLTWERNHGRVA